MNILILGDVMGPSGREALKLNLKNIISEKKIDFTIVNGENAADNGKGITKEITEEFFNIGVDVITSGNHIWDKAEATQFISKEERLLRPANMVEGSPGNGYGIYPVKNKNLKVAVINLMGNVFMKKTEDVFKTAEKYRLPAGGALADDRILLSEEITTKLKNHPNIRVSNEEVTDLPPSEDGKTIVATGPLTSSKLLMRSWRLLGNNLLRSLMQLHQLFIQIVLI